MLEKPKFFCIILNIAKEVILEYKLLTALILSENTERHLSQYNGDRVFFQVMGKWLRVRYGDEFSVYFMPYLASQSPA